MPRTAGKLGRKPPTPEKPRLVINEYLNFSALPLPPQVVDYSTKIPADSWGMMMNGPDPQNPPQIPDGIGDCTFAARGHDTLARTAYASQAVTLPNSTLLRGYENVGGYVLGNPGTDNGCVMQEVLNYCRQIGLTDSAGKTHKDYAFAQLAGYDNQHIVTQALYIFGSVYVGVNFPQAAMQQFNDGLPWTAEPGDTIEGGHCVALQRWDPRTPNGYYKVVTWGREQAVRVTWWDTYVEEAWVVITPDWLTSTGATIDGFNLAALQSDLTQITAEKIPLK